MPTREPLSQDSAPVIRLVTCLGVDLELPLLAHFIDHYAQLGIAPHRMHVTLNSADPDSPNLEAARSELAARGTAAPDVWIAPYTSDGMWARRRERQRAVAGPGDWIVNADIDEHHRYPAPLPEVVRAMARKDHNAVQGFLIDRLAPDGALNAVATDRPLAEQFPIEAEADLSLAGRGENHGIDGTLKMMLHRADILPSRGGHNPSAEGAEGRFLAGQRLARHPRAADPAFRFAFPFRVDHYKWTATRMETVRRRLGTPGVSPAGKEFGGKIMRYLAEHGRVRLEDVVLRDADAGGRLPWAWQHLGLRLAVRARHAVRSRR